MKHSKVLENEAFDAIFPFGHVELHQSSDLPPGRFHVGQPLGLVNSPDFLDTLPFHNPLVFDQDVHSVSTIRPNVNVLCRKGQLELKRDLVSAQFMSEVSFPGRFEQCRSEVTVNLARTSDHAVRELVEFHFRAFRVLRGCLN